MNLSKYDDDDCYNDYDVIDTHHHCLSLVAEDMTTTPDLIAGTQRCDGEEV